MNDENWKLETFGGGKSEVKLCSICGFPYEGYGNNPQPVLDDYEARCCDRCNATVVVPERQRRISRGHSAY